MNLDKTKFISIIIPTYNRKASLVQCLKGIIQQNFPKNSFEVIVVDDGSTVVLDNVLSEFNTKITLKLLHQKQSGPAQARNYGASQAKGNILVFIDDDCIPYPDWLNLLVVGVKNDFTLVGGKTVNNLRDNIYSATSQVIVDYVYSVNSHQKQETAFFASNNFALSAKLFSKVGGFDMLFKKAAGEDRKFCYDAVKQGAFFVYLPEAKIYHCHQLTFCSFIKQHFNYGQGAFLFRNQCTRKGKLIIFEPLSYYWNLLCYPLSEKMDNRYKITVMIFISQLATTIGFYVKKYQCFYGRLRLANEYG